MSVHANLSEVASLLAEESRASILMGLMDGRFHTASELAYMAGIKPQTASYHLAKMLEARVVIVENHGRHRYYQLISHDVAQIVESLLALSRPPEIRSLKQSTQLKDLRQARVCYDHLAGELGVNLTQSMVDSGFLVKCQQEYALTPLGEEYFRNWGLDLSTLRKQKRSFSRACLDWSERKHHLAGALGQAMMSQLIQLNWIAREPESRAVTITELGIRELTDTFNIRIKNTNIVGSGS